MSEHEILYRQQTGPSAEQAVCACGALIQVLHLLRQTVPSQLAKHIRDAVPTRAEINDSTIPDTGEDAVTPPTWTSPKGHDARLLNELAELVEGDGWVDLRVRYGAAARILNAGWRPAESPDDEETP